MRWPWLLDWGVPIFFGAWLWYWIPIDTALEFGTDEGFELMKALLVSRGHSLYGPFWNDQPPLHTVLLAALFQAFGPSAYVGRMLSIGFSAMLVRALYGLVSDRTNRAAGLLAVALITASPLFLQLSVSVMLELPAMSLAMASAWGWFHYARVRQTKWLVLSGALFGFALQVKFTAVLFLPAFWVDYLATIRAADTTPAVAKRDGAASLRPLYVALLWCGASIAAFGLILALSYQPGTLDSFFSSHFSMGTRQFGGAIEHRFEPASILSDWAVLVPTSIAAALIALRRRQDLLFPLALLLTACAVHTWNRPFWNYYYLHFSIPFAWLASVGIVESFRELLRSGSLASHWSKVRAGGLIFTWGALTSLTLTTLPGRWSHELAIVGSAIAERQDPVASAFKLRAGQTRWIFTHSRIAAFWAGIAIPPELAVIPSKRLWSGQIKTEDVRASLEKYKPELIFIPTKWERLFDLESYLKEHYKEDSGTDVSGLFVRRPE